MISANATIIFFCGAWGCLKSSTTTIVHFLEKKEKKIQQI
jgi:hypothetical protein